MVVALIPAYNPSEQLVALVRELAASDFTAVIIVDDGSSSDCKPFFSQIEGLDKVILLQHAVNLGKGAALKTGLNHAYCHFPEMLGVVTLDADGQHLVEDALNVAECLNNNRDKLVVGARAFDKDVPLRSKIGNSLTRYLFRLLTGNNLTDTQSGLRGVPKEFIPALLRIKTGGYEFELDMLLACKYSGRPIIEQQIRTVYIEGNSSSHFNPLIDSMKIYFVLFRYTLTSLVSALIDYSIFLLLYKVTAGIFLSHATARAVSMLFNYTVVKKVVFYSGRTVSNTFPKYLSLVCISGLVSYLLIKVLIMFTPLTVIAAKVCAESVVFLANFAIQRDFIFVGEKSRKKANRRKHDPPERNVAPTPSRKPLYRKIYWAMLHLDAWG